MTDTESDRNPEKLFVCVMFFNITLIIWFFAALQDLASMAQTTLRFLPGSQNE